MRIALAAVAWLCAIVLVAALAGFALGQDLPDRRRTPGVVDPRVTQANIETTICAPGYSAKMRPPSSYTSKLKREQLALRGPAGADPDDYEEDHLISIELGGAPRDPRNLWPQPWDGCGAHRKDVLENRLHFFVCERRISLVEAQNAIALDWVAAYRRYLGEDPCR